MRRRDDRVIGVEHASADEPAADEQERVVLPAVEAHERQGADIQREERGRQLHQRMECGVALPA
jgi:hypothetical protein